MIADDLFAGAGGWDLASAQLSIHARGVLPAGLRAERNPYIEHDDFCGCAYCRSAALGGGA